MKRNKGKEGIRIGKKNMMIKGDKGERRGLMAWKE